MLVFFMFPETGRPSSLRLAIPTARATVFGSTGTLACALLASKRNDTPAECGPGDACSRSNSCRMNTYASPASNPFRMRTYKIGICKSRGMNTYKKVGEGGRNYCYAVPGEARAVFGARRIVVGTLADRFVLPGEVTRWGERTIPHGHVPR